jgi:hypothetical protein
MEDETDSKNIYNFFDTFHDLKTKKYYGEDFGFCQKWTDIGGKCYCYIGRFITHVGEYQYSGRFRDELKQQQRLTNPIKSSKLYCFQDKYACLKDVR